MDSVDNVMAKTHNIIVVFDGKAKMQDGPPHIRALYKHRHIHTHPRRKIAAVSNRDKAEKNVFVYRWILCKYLLLPVPLHLFSSPILSSFVRVYVCINVSITYVCQLSRFLRGLMVKSYYVQTTVNKCRYSWSGVNGHGYTDDMTVVQYSLTYWNCYICVLSLSLSHSVFSSFHFVFRYGYLLVADCKTLKYRTVFSYCRSHSHSHFHMHALFPSFSQAYGSQNDTDRKYYECTVCSCFYYPIKVIAASGSIFLL